MSRGKLLYRLWAKCGQYRQPKSSVRKQTRSDQGFLCDLTVRVLGRYLNSGPEAKKIRDLLERALSERVERLHAPSSTAPARLSVEQNIKIIALYEDGWGPKEIAEALGTTEWTVHHRLKRNGVVRRPIGMPPAEIKEALRLNDSGVPITELCKRFGRSWKTIAKELRLARDQALGS